MSPEVLGFGALALILVAAGVLWTLRPGRSGGDERPPYVRALSALVDGDSDTAVAEFKLAVRQDSGNADAYLRLGDLFRERGDVERAFQIHRELSARTGLANALRARIQLSLSRDLVALGRLRTASDAIAEAVRLAEDPVPAMEMQLAILKRRGDVDGSFRVRREILKRQGRTKSADPVLAEFRVEQAETLLRKGTLDVAEKVLKDARKLDATNDRAAILWGILKEKQGDYAAAIAAWREVLSRRPKAVADLFRNLERVRFLDGSFSEMEPEYEGYHDDTPGQEEASFGLARFLRRKGSLDRGLDVVRRGLDENPHSVPLRVLHLALLLEVGRSGEAQSVLNDWLSETLGDGPGRAGTSALAAAGAANEARRARTAS